MRKLIFVLALGAILLPNLGFTLGLGEIEVDSSLNQKLTARIELLSAVPEDAETLLVTLASREEFVRAGLDRPLVLTTLKFKTVVVNDKVFIDILSTSPVREPFLNFLVEVDWPKGHLIREYTILLDPPSFMSKKQDVASTSDRPAMHESSGEAPASVQSSAGMGVFEAVESANESVAESFSDAPVQQHASYTAPAGHRVQAGDTAWSIANNMRPDDSVSTEQMLLAMLRANPEVFINENVNGLKRGYILRTPDYSDISAVSHEEAKEAVRQQNALWREYQQSLSSDLPASAIDDQYEESEYSSAVDMNDDSRLSIVSAGNGSSTMGEMKDPSEMTADELREQLALARERVETERVEKENLQQQVGTLSAQVNKMTGLLDVEDDAMAEIQSVGDDSYEELAVDDLSEELSDELPADELVGEPLDEDQALDALDVMSSEDDTAVENEELFVDEAAESSIETDVIVEQEILEEVEPAFTQPKEVSLIDTLLNNKMVIGGLALVLLIIGAIGYLIKRRRNSTSSEPEVSPVVEVVAVSEEDSLEDVADMIDDESLDDLVSDEEIEASMAEAESEEEFDADATMILPSGTDTEAAIGSAPPEEEQDDVLAEADVYLAYGIYQQAEELLENAIKENPDKDNYRLKLAETYFAGKNADSFAKLGTDMKQRQGDKTSPVWEKVAAMGKELCPDNEIFQQASSELDLGDMLPKSPEPMDFDLGEEAADDSVLDLDFDSPLDELDAGELDLPTDELELPSMEESMDETAIISPDETAIIPAVSEELDELEFDLSETDAIEEAPVEDMADLEEEEFSLDIEASELGLDVASEELAEESLDTELDMDLDMSIDSALESVDETADEDDGELDLDLDMSMTEDSASDDAGEFDLTEEAASMDLDEDSSDDLMADLDLSMEDIVAEDESTDLDMSLDDDLDDMDLSEPLDAEEVGTKLDLAKAYLDMGDHEGARDILEEVIASGNDEQKKEAEELMSQAG